MEPRIETTEIKLVGEQSILPAGDFEVYEWLDGRIGQQPRSEVHQIWIPVVRKESTP